VGVATPSVDTATSDLVGLTLEIRKLVDKLGPPKRKDLWDIISALTPFLATVVVTGLSLYFTQAFQRNEAERTRAVQASESSRATRFTEAQMESLRSQTRVEELKALTALAPVLASPDAATRHIGRQMLSTIQGSEEAVTTATAPPSSAALATDGTKPLSKAERSPGAPIVEQSRQLSIISGFARIALSAFETDEARIAATKKIGAIATATNSTPTQRRQAAGVAGQIAADPATPPSVRSVAKEVAASLRRLSQANDQVQRTADEALTAFESRAKAMQQRLNPAPPILAPGYPILLKNAKDARLPPSLEESILQMRRALEVGSRYTALLVAVAEGKKDQQVRSKLAELGGALMTLGAVSQQMPALSSPAALGAQFIKLAQDAVGREQLIVAIYQGEVYLRVLYQTLEEQAEPMYRLAVIGTLQEQAKVKDEIQRAALQLKALCERFAPPVDVDLALRVAAMQVRAREVGVQTQTLAAMSIPFPFVVGKPAADKEPVAQIDLVMDSLQTSAKVYASLIADQNDFHGTLVRYKAALTENRKAFESEQLRFAQRQSERGSGKRASAPAAPSK